MKQLAILFIAVLCLTSCSKYEEGPVISFRGKTERLVNSWGYLLVLRNGNNITFGNVDGTINYAASSIGFEDGGRFTSINYNDSLFVQEDGNWTFESKKEAVLLDYDNGNQRVLSIIKLKEKEVWLEETFDDNIIQYQLFPNK